jgi:RNA polymerase sigma-70 factor (ECF subfamily)
VPVPLVTTTLLLDRLRDSRDSAAWAAFDARFRGVIVSTALRLGLSDADASDAAQETILQALRDYQQGKYDRSRGRLSAWIIAIAHHRIVDIMRARTRDRDRTRGSLERARGIPDDVPTPERVADSFHDALERTIFERAWERVHAESRIAPETLLAFELSALRHVPPQAVAERCGMSVDQVYVAKSRVARRLQEIVEEISRAYRDGL